ncbi:hypothetical protein SARC_00182 [Sphaeroforma arctica JP610]|uniref:LTD domain-containing protein n=1 Tax=Sphaeroforma arctica JP610 TaxID=667725 RepID=A0A0L0GHD2_9EUKA|nr:hypothetical protein SARC_00182 [Sphaeroforma arctica JP610]KNC87748.1 hypothetical protein SARC_00182 [Sphaeroforma arctica JP610]|eukprot:XP_014161650.1 hypothetical protein SARC_00182 [Sphaeroforma arctica JP610]
MGVVQNVLVALASTQITQITLAASLLSTTNVVNSTKAIGNATDSTQTGVQAIENTNDNWTSSENITANANSRPVNQILVEQHKLNTGNQTIEKNQTASTDFNNITASNGAAGKSDQFNTTIDKIGEDTMLTETDNITTNGNASAVTNIANTAEYIRLSEVNSKSLDWVELFNPSNYNINLTGAFLIGRKSSQIYSFKGDCGEIGAGMYMLLVDSDTTNTEYSNKDCMLDFGIKSSGSLSLFDIGGNLMDTTSWQDTAYVSGHSWARNSVGQWQTTSTQTPFFKNIFTDEITMPAAVDLTAGLADRNLAYVQNPPFGSVTNVNVFVHEWSSSCTCNQFQEAHNDEKCGCSWTDVQEDRTGTDLRKIVMPCSVSIDVDGVPEFWYKNVFDGNSTVLQPHLEENCNIAVRGGFTRHETIKSYNIKFSKTTLPSTWRGLERLNMVKTPWEEMNGALTATLFEQFSKMNGFVGMRTTVANLTVTVVDQDTGNVLRVENQGRYVLMENWDEDALDRHGLAARNSNGDREDAHLYKLNSFDFTWISPVYDNMAPFVDETDEVAMAEFEVHLEAKDSKNNTKLYYTLMALNQMTNISFVDAIHKHFDLENLAQWLAVNIACGDSDHQGKNQYIYSSEGTDVWYFTPWDYDACWDVVMDNGPPSVSVSLYNSHYLFRNIMFWPELRDKFYPALKAKLTELRQGVFERFTIEQLLTKNAEVIVPFMQKGQTDRDLLYRKPYNYEPTANQTFSPYINNADKSPLNNTMGQYDFVMEAMDNYTMSDPPPTCFGEIKVRTIESEDTQFNIQLWPLFSPVDHRMDTIITFYKNHPDFNTYGNGDEEHTIFDYRFWAPPYEDIVYDHYVSQSISNSTEMNVQMKVPIECAKVWECRDDSCHITVHTVDLETGMQSAYAHYNSVIQFMGDDSNCDWSLYDQDGESDDEENDSEDLEEDADDSNEDSKDSNEGSDDETPDDEQSEEVGDSDEQ